MFVAVCLGVFCLTFWPIVRSVTSARRFASEMGPGEVRLLGACRSKRFGIRSGFPVVVLEVGSSDSRFVAFVGRRSQSHVVATSELRFKWHDLDLCGARCVVHEAVAPVDTGGPQHSAAVRSGHIELERGGT